MRSVQWCWFSFLFSLDCSQCIYVSTIRWNWNIGLTKSIYALMYANYPVEDLMRCGWTESGAPNTNVNGIYEYCDNAVVRMESNTASNSFMWIVLAKCAVRTHIHTGYSVCWSALPSMMERRLVWARISTISTTITTSTDSMRSLLIYCRFQFWLLAIGDRFSQYKVVVTRFTVMKTCNLHSLVRCYAVSCTFK